MLTIYLFLSVFYLNYKNFNYSHPYFHLKFSSPLGKKWAEYLILQMKLPDLAGVPIQITDPKPL